MPYATGDVLVPTGGAPPAVPNLPVALGRSRETLVTELHGKFYAAVKSGRCFIAAQTGITIPLNAAALVSVFSLWNPMGSGVDMELIDADVWTVSATEVVNDVALYYQAAVGSAIAVPGTLTKANPVNLYPVAAPGTNQVQYYTALTHVGTPSLLHPLVDIQATASGIAGSGHYEFDGKLLIPPGTVISLATTTGAEASAGASIKWAEWPV